MSSLTQTQPPPELRIVRRRTIDVDPDAAQLVADANKPQPTRAVHAGSIGWAVLAVGIVVLLFVLV